MLPQLLNAIGTLAIKVCGWNSEPEPFEPVTYEPGKIFAFAALLLEIVIKFVPATPLATTVVDVRPTPPNNLSFPAEPDMASTLMSKSPNRAVFGFRFPPISAQTFGRA